MTPYPIVHFDATYPSEWKTVESAPDRTWVMIAHVLEDKKITIEPAIRGWENNEDKVDLSGKAKADGWYLADCIRVIPGAWRPLKEGE